MTHYKSNLRDIEFNLFEVFGAGDRLGTGPFAEMDADTARDFLNAGRARWPVGPLADTFAAPTATRRCTTRRPRPSRCPRTSRSPTAR